jgi:hypothetical protein
MRRILFCLLLAPASTFAQNFELGLGVGISTNTRPSDNMPYKGDKLTINYALAFDVLYNISDYLQAGVEAHATQLSRKSSTIYTTFYGNKIGNDNKRFVYAKSATAICAVLNGKLPAKNGYAYGGLALGYGAARHDSKTLSSNESYRAPNGGNGLVFGLQVGYVLGITERIGFSAQAALRHFSLKYDAMEPTGTTAENLKYNIMSFPITVGIRYRIKGGKDDAEIKRQSLMQVGLNY